MSGQALINCLDVAESAEPWSQEETSSRTSPFIRDPESMGRPYGLEDETKCLRYTQGSCSASSLTDSTIAESNVERSDEGIRPLKPILFRRPKLHPLDRFVSLQKWEGVVLAVEHDSFFARLVDLTQGNPQEEGEFSLDDVSNEDRPLLKPGSIFYWNIGYHDSRTGQRRKVSEIRFRRLPAWTLKEIEDARQGAIRLRDLLGWK
jgi:hypothetical protein